MKTIQVNAELTDDHARKIVTMGEHLKITAQQVLDMAIILAFNSVSKGYIVTHHNSKDGYLGWEFKYR